MPNQKMKNNDLFHFWLLYYTSTLKKNLNQNQIQPLILFLNVLFFDLNIKSQTN